MKCIHNNGYVHLDLKPDNIIMNSNGDIQLIDFGYAQQFGTELLYNSIGTKGYQSNHDYDNASKFQDYNSIGVTIQNILDYYKSKKNIKDNLSNFITGTGFKQLQEIADTFKDKDQLHTDENLIENSINVLTKGGRNMRISKKSRRKSRKTKRKSNRRSCRERR